MRILAWLLVLAVAMPLSMAGTPVERTAEELYQEALDALETEDLSGATDAITRALAKTPQETVLPRVKALKLIARYELRTGRKEQARDHLNAALRIAGTRYAETHPEMVHIKWLLKKIDTTVSPAEAGQPR